MSAYSTLRITESKARSLVVTAALTANRETLVRMVDDVLGERLYTCDIVPDGWEDNDDGLV